MLLAQLTDSYVRLIPKPASSWRREQVNSVPAQQCKRKATAILHTLPNKNVEGDYIFKQLQRFFVKTACHAVLITGFFERRSLADWQRSSKVVRQQQCGRWCKTSVLVSKLGRTGPDPQDGDSVEHIQSVEGLYGQNSAGRRSRLCTRDNKS